jgi:flavin reductase (DIM6/NTAB) family NADH-FMN oxidoreductase RutF
MSDQTPLPGDTAAHRDPGIDPGIETGFTPDAANARAFRCALGQFATGVTVITCNSPIGPLGITANSFASVSLDPPLVLWSPAKSSKRFEAFTQARHYAIHVMSAKQADICNGFITDGNAFAGYDWHPSASGVPLINHCLARFECTQSALHDAGDHAIVVGQVMRVTTQDPQQAGDPLMFYAGNYGGFHAS